MDKHLNVLHQALNKANQSGAFTLQESAMVAQSLNIVTQALESTEKQSPIEKARQEAREKQVLKAVDSAESKGNAPVEGDKKEDKQ